VLEPVNDLKQAEEEIRRLTERLTVALKSAAIGCWEWDIQRNTLIWDERMYELYGVESARRHYEPYDIWINGVHPDDRRVTEALLEQAVLGQAEFDTEFRVIHPDGRTHYVKASGSVLRDADGTPQRMIGVNFDISDRKLYEYQLEELSLTDPLTGLGNRRYFEKELDRHWTILQRYGIPFALIMLDYNDFRSINEHGHAVGDRVLQDGAAKLRASVRAECAVSRTGGDEAAVIMPCSPDIEKAIAETNTVIARISEALNTSVVCQGQEIHYSVSVGGAVCSGDVLSVEDLYRAADSDMMERKRVGKLQASTA